MWPALPGASLKLTVLPPPWDIHPLCLCLSSTLTPALCLSSAKPLLSPCCALSFQNIDSLLHCTVVDDSLLHCTVVDDSCGVAINL